MIGNRQQQVRFYCDFYRDYYHKILNYLMVSCAAILFLTLAIIYFVVFHPTPDFFATSLGGQLIPMAPKQ